MTGSLVLLLENLCCVGSYCKLVHDSFKIGKVKFESKSMFENLILFKNEFYVMFEYIYFCLKWVKD